ncbi:membrane protein PM19L-like [Argentina anserina]|uniref:membrane protein PM19L-like n=1 Tax=Argentina anserina TaxID=57926 RepID=UPI00217635E9|nr:membrane protein PM19L-like [Potentilla anserina]
MAPLLAVNLVIHLIVVGLAGWSLDKYIDGEQNHPHLGGNTSTSFMLIFALIAGAFGACSVIVGIMHQRAWQHESHAAAASLAIISWAMIALAFGFVCKEVILGRHRGKRLQTLELLIVISLLSQLLYLVLLNAGLFKRRYGPTVI